MLTLGSVGALVFFIHDVTKGIRVESITLPRPRHSDRRRLTPTTAREARRGADRGG
ncbi:MAG: hypothetical protein ACREME_00310 [Gemmatimonadales bacterium]